MSKEKCQEVKKLLKQALSALVNNECGEGRCSTLALQYIEDAYLRLDQHMRVNKWVDSILPQASHQVIQQPSVNGAARIDPTPSGLRTVTGLRTGMGPTDLPALAAQQRTAQTPTPRPTRPIADILDDISVLG